MTVRIVLADYPSPDKSSTSSSPPTLALTLSGEGEAEDEGKCPSGKAWLREGEI